MATAKSDDLFVVNRNDTAYSVRQDELMALIQPTDYMAINRNDITYKITGSEVIDSFIPELKLNEVILNTQSPVCRSSLSVTLDAEGGSPPYQKDYQWSAKNDVSGVPEYNMVGATDASLYIPDDLFNYQFACSVVLTDSRGNTASNKSVFTDPAVAFVRPPVLSSVTIQELGTSLIEDRFTNETFAVQATMEEEGIPQSTKNLIAYCDGDINIEEESDVITSFEVRPNGYLVTTNDPAGGTDLYKVLAGNEVGNNPGSKTGYATVPVGYYIEFTYPFPFDIVEGAGGVGLDMDGTQGQAEIYVASDRDPFPGAFSVKSNFNLGTYGGYGGAGASYSNLGECLNVTGVRIKMIGPNPVGVAAFGNNNLLDYKERPVPGEGGIYLAQEDVYPVITFASDKAIKNLEAGDVIKQVNSNVEATVYRVDGNEVWLRREDQNKGFVPGAKVECPPKVNLAARVYLVMNANGNVLDLSTTEQPVTVSTIEPSPTFNIKFPATFSTGSTPDQELLPGTSITAEVYAENTLIKTQERTATMTPGALPFGEMTPEQREESNLLLTTYENRKAFVSAQEAIEAKAELIQQLLASGYTQAEIDAIYSTVDGV